MTHDTLFHRLTVVFQILFVVTLDVLFVFCHAPNTENRQLVADI